MKEQENKTQQILIRTTPAEKKILQEKAAQAHMSLSSYMIALSENKKIVVAENIPQLLVEITRIGTNINQITHICNSQKYIKADQLAEVKELMRDVKSIMNKILYELFLDNQKIDLKSLDKKLNIILSLLENND